MTRKEKFGNLKKCFWSGHEIYKNTLSFETERRSAVTLGKFDGLHRGHMLLVDRVLELGKQEGLETVVFTFAVPPSSQVAHEPAHQLLTNEERRLRLETREWICWWSARLMRQ